MRRALSPSELGTLREKPEEELSLAEVVFLQGLRLKELEARVATIERTRRSSQFIEE